MQIDSLISGKNKKKHFKVSSAEINMYLIGATCICVSKLSSYAS